MKRGKKGGRGKKGRERGRKGGRGEEREGGRK